MVLCVAFLAFCGFVLASEVCQAQSHTKPTATASQYEELRQRYFKLRNTDLSLRQQEEWRTVAKDYQRFIERPDSRRDVPQALLNLSSLHQALFERFGREEDRALSLQALNRLIKEFPSDQLADDALFRAAELMEILFEDREGARKLYERVYTRYPRSEYSVKARVAAARLLQGESHSEKGGLLRDPLRSPAAGEILRTRRWLVVLDPGHGGDDLGARGPGGLYEKDVVLAIAMETKRILEKNVHVQAVLTREADSFVPLARRTQLANELEADVFVSLHNNASANQALSGLQSFYLDAAKDDAGRLLAERENGGHLPENEGGDLAMILGDLTQSAKQGPSITLTHLLHDEILGTTRSKWKGFKDLGVRPGPFYVLVGARMPCALLELFFLDNPDDAKRLATKDFRSLVAQGISSGIVQFLERSDSRGGG